MLPMDLDETASPMPGTPSRSWLRRRGPGLVAVLLVVATAIGLVWFVATSSIAKAYDGEAGGDCASSPRDVLDQFTKYSPVPDVPEFADARRAVHDLLQSDRWRLDLSSKGMEPDDVPFHVVVVRDEDAVEFRRDNGTIGRITPDRTLLTTTDASMWLSTCDDPSFVLFSPGRTGCTGRQTRGRETVFTWRLVGAKADCDATVNVIDYELVIRDRSVVGWEFRLTTETGSSDDRWTVQPPVELDDPWPWEVVPGWFVNLVAS